jgi:hypothetical protein
MNNNMDSSTFKRNEVKELKKSREITIHIKKRVGFLISRKS